MINDEMIFKILNKIDNFEKISEKEEEQLSNCTDLDWSFWDIDHIPKSISQLKRLRFLNFSGIRITKLPDELCELTQLQELVLRDNELKGLPEAFGNLKQLHSLDLSGNFWKEIPEQIRSIESLRYINISNCNFDEIPKWILDFHLDFHFTESASGIILENTTSITPDISLFHQKRATILKYFYLCG